MVVHQGLLAAAVFVLTLSGCNRPPGDAQPPAGGAAPLSGNVTVDGSSTVLPMSSALANAFRQQHPGVRIAIESSGTGGGFRKFCMGGVDLAGASRPINSSESRDCQANHVEYIELPVAFDSVAVVVSRTNSFVSCLTVGELKRMWEPSAAGQVVRWNHIRSGLPAQPLALFGPGTDSGTFDYFTLAVVGSQSQSRRDYTASENDEAIATAVAADSNALGYFGYAYYREHADTLKLVAVDKGSGCVVPGPDTVADRRYEPLSRPVFVYVTTRAASRNDANAFASFYVDPQNSPLVESLGYVPLPPATLVAVSRRLANGVTGSIFGGRGSVLGVTTDTFRDDDRIRNALVQ